MAKSDYYSRERFWPFLLGVSEGAKVLDIGCGKGTLGDALKRIANASVTGVEIIPENCRVAEKVLDNVICGDIQTDIESIKGNFDYIIFSDSLEHLVNVEDVIKKIKHLCSEKGKILLSVPNVRNFRVLIDLIFFDEWRYTDEGLLDKTHLRFFTYKSLIRLFKENGYEVEKVLYELPLKSKSGIINMLTFGLFRKVLTSHYYLQVSP